MKLPDTLGGEAERATSADGQDIRDGVSGAVVFKTQDLAVSNHGRMGRYYVLRT